MFVEISFIDMVAPLRYVQKAMNISDIIARNDCDLQECCYNLSFMQYDCVNAR